MLDSLVSVKLVTAKGDLITVSESHHQGLFWGIRGAGFNFGIVTEATFRVYDTTYSGQVLEGDLLFPASANRSIFQLVASYDETLPKELSLTTVLSYNPKTDKSSIILNIIYFGAKERAQPYIDPFLKLGPTKTNITMVPWNKLYAYLFFGGNSTACRENQYLSSAGQGLRRTDPATFETFFGDMTNFLRQYKAIAGTFVATRFPNQADKVLVPRNNFRGPSRKPRSSHYTIASGSASDRVLADVGGFVQQSGEFPTRPGTSENWRDPLLNQHRPDSSLPARTSFEPSTNCSRRCRASGGNVRHRPVALVRGTRIGHWHLYSVRSHISDLPTARWVGVVWGPEYLTGSKAQEASQDIPIPDRVSRLVPIYFSMCNEQT
ncbi:MAG: hypothetical protein L6R35_004097 [Caloplaca aegaea]|nr:MAG: hypothetical protein L6R35_004097 [Caloplaca aegaea]